MLEKGSKKPSKVARSIPSKSASSKAGRLGAGADKKASASSPKAKGMRQIDAYLTKTAGPRGSAKYKAARAGLVGGIKAATKGNKAEKSSMVPKPKSPVKGAKKSAPARAPRRSRDY